MSQLSQLLRTSSSPRSALRGAVRAAIRPPHDPSLGAGMGTHRLRWFPAVAGVILVEASKQIYAADDLGPAPPAGLRGAAQPIRTAIRSQRWPPVADRPGRVRPVPSCQMQLISRRFEAELQRRAGADVEPRPDAPCSAPPRTPAPVYRDKMFHGMRSTWAPAVTSANRPHPEAVPSMY